MEATPGGNRDALIPLLDLGGGGLVLLGGQMSIGFNGKIKWGKEQTRGPAKPFKQDHEPCDYVEGCEQDAE